MSISEIDIARLTEYGNDKARRDAAVDAFTTAVKVRLDEQAAKGYTGWDGDYPTDKLARELAEDVADLRNNLPIGSFHMTLNNVLIKRVVDIGARAMMLHYRSSNARNQGLALDKKS